MSEETQVPRAIRRLLGELVLNGVLKYERNEDGEPTFTITEAGKEAIEQWMLELDEDAD